MSSTPTHFSGHRRVFLGWGNPFLTNASRWLIDTLADQRLTQGGTIDLGDVIVVLQTSRATRRLLELLVEQSHELEKILVPPRMMTMGELPELLIEIERPRASKLQRQFARIEAVRRVPAEILRRVLPSAPKRNDVGGWTALSDLLERLHTELSASSITFSDVARSAEELASEEEGERWRALEKIHGEYLKVLIERDLSDPHENRREALTKPINHHLPTIVLGATTDLNKITQELLRRAPSVTALIFAPQEMEEGFNEFGVLVPEAWNGRTIEIDDTRMRVAHNETGQAIASMDVLEAMAAHFRAEDIVLGACDERVVPALLQECESNGVTARSADGIAFSQTPPALLLQCVMRYCDGLRSYDFYSLVRHPHLYRWLEQRLFTEAPAIVHTFLTQLDRFHTEHLRAIATDLPGSLRVLGELVQELLGGLLEAPRPLPEWETHISALLVKLFGGRTLSRHVETDRIIVESCDLIRGALEELSLAPPERFTAADAINLILHTLSGARIKPEPSEEAIEVLGWLELPLDDAPAAIITGFNEGKVPESINGDPFLPNSLRSAVGLVDNSLRFVRDLYSLSTVLHSKREVHLILGRFGATEGLLLPSRLLYLTAEKRVAERVHRFFEHSESTALPSLPQGTSPAATSAFTPPFGAELTAKEPVHLSVTGIDDYLQCPYRFYLRHVKKLERIDDAALEMGPPLFGIVAHTVLNRFAHSPSRAATQASEVRDTLYDLLDIELRQRFGRSHLPAIALQSRRLRERLDAFARWQAEWAKEGWEPWRVEYSLPKDEAALLIDGKRVPIAGRIDRIDRNRATGEMVIFDYKTSDNSFGPEESHRKRGEWTKLQLPLYKILLQEAGILGEVEEDQVRVGYITLGKYPRDVMGRLALWTADDIKEARGVACEVVRQIEANVFWPPSQLPWGSHDAYKLLCPYGELEGEELSDE